MLSPATVAIATTHWASEFNCAPDTMFKAALHQQPHGPALADYNGIFALFREGRAMVSMPPARLQELSQYLPPRPDLWAATFRGLGFRVIGPAFIGYAESLPPNCGSAARALQDGDSAAVARLAAACAPQEWDHGGSDPEVPCSAVFTADGEIAALAGYEIWSDTIAHISIITHPAHRSHGHAREAVAHLANRALTAGLLPQYRTLESNAPSVRIAAALGFHHYATSVAVRLAEQG